MHDLSDSIEAVKLIGEVKVPKFAFCKHKDQPPATAKWGMGDSQRLTIVWFAQCARVFKNTFKEQNAVNAAPYLQHKKLWRFWICFRASNMIAL